MLTFLSLSLFPVACCVWRSLAQSLKPQKIRVGIIFSQNALPVAIKTAFNSRDGALLALHKNFFYVYSQSNRLFMYQKESVMKKYTFYIILICTTLTNLQAIHLGSVSPSDIIAPELSISQLFQLNIFQEQLRLYAPLIIHDGMNNENAQILIQQTELAIQQSSPETQSLMKSRIVQLFENFDIQVAFNAENILSLVSDTTTDQEKQDQKTSKRFIIHKKKQSRHFFGIDKNSDKSWQPKPLPKIHGARRTMNRLRKKRELQEKIAKERLALEQQIKKQKTTDLNEERISREQKLKQTDDQDNEFDFAFIR